MNVIIVYDVNHKRVSKVMKICRKYLTRVQNSVFEGNISESKLESLKNEIFQKIDFTQDKVCIYKLESLKYISKEEIGAVEKNDNII